MKKQIKIKSNSETIKGGEMKSKTSRMKWEIESFSEGILIPPMSGVWSLRNDCTLGQWKAEETPIGSELPMVLIDATFGRGLIPPISSLEKYYKSILERKQKPLGFSPSWFAFDEFNQVTGIAKPQEILELIFEENVKDWAFIWFVPASNWSHHVPHQTLCGTFIKSTSLSRRGTGFVEYLEGLKIARKSPHQVITTPQFRPTHKNAMDGKDCLGLVWESIDLEKVEDAKQKQEYQETLKAVEEWINSEDFPGELQIPGVANQWIECEWGDLENGNPMVEKKLAMKIASNLGICNAELEIDEFLGLTLPWDDKPEQIASSPDVKQLAPSKSEK